MKGDALQTFRNNNTPTPQKLGGNLAIFRRKCVKSQSMVTVKHKMQNLVFLPANQKSVDLLVELQKLAKNACGIATHSMIEHFKNGKTPPHLKKSKNQAHLENGSYEQIVNQLEKKLNGLEAPEELEVNTAPTCHKHGNRRNQTNVPLL